MRYTVCYIVGLSLTLCLTLPEVSIGESPHKESDSADGVCAEGVGAHRNHRWSLGRGLILIEEPQNGDGRVLHVSRYQLIGSELGYRSVQLIPDSKLSEFLPWKSTFGPPQIQQGDGGPQSFPGMISLRSTATDAQDRTLKVDCNYMILDPAIRKVLRLDQKNPVAVLAVEKSMIYGALEFWIEHRPDHGSQALHLRIMTQEPNAYENSKLSLLEQEIGISRYLGPGEILIDFEFQPFTQEFWFTTSTGKVIHLVATEPLNLDSLVISQLIQKAQALEGVANDEYPLRPLTFRKE